MFHSFLDLKGFTVRAIDEPEGSVDDLYFDDETWRVRYLVAGTGFWLIGRQSLVNASLLGAPDVEKREFPVELTAEQIKAAPEPDADAPVSEQERAAARKAVDQWPPFLIGPAGAGYTPLLADAQIRRMMENGEAAPEPAGDPHLRSMEEAIGYDIVATDDSIGTVSDFLVNPLDWAVRYVVVDTGTWLPGRQVVLATNWTREIDHAERRWVVDVTKRQIETSPELDDIPGLQRPQEDLIHSHYGVAPYWGV